MEEKITSQTKPQNCPKCGGEKVASIMYGLPVFDEELDSAMESGKIILGGCWVTDCDPRWQCVKCGTKIYRESDVFPEGRQA